VIGGSPFQPLSGDELTAAPRQDEKTAASRDQTRQSRTHDRTGDLRELLLHEWDSPTGIYPDVINHQEAGDWCEGYGLFEIITRRKGYTVG